MIDLRKKIIKYVKKLNSTNLSALRSGNISIRASTNGINGFLITPSGIKYNNLEPKNIIFISESGLFENEKTQPSSEWKAHRDIYLLKKEEYIYLHQYS